MKITRLLTSAVLAAIFGAAALVSAVAVGQTSTTSPWAGSLLTRVTYAALPAASSVPAGVRFTATDLGSNGCDVVSNATRWRPVNGSAMLASLGAPVASVANTETIVLQTLIPAGAWQANDTIRIWLVGTKTGATDTFSLTVRVGTAGTTSDTAVLGLSAYQFMTASGLAGGGTYDVKLLTNTSAQKLGGGVSGTSTYTPNETSGGAAATTITDASANALWVSVSVSSSGTTNTVGVPAAQIQIITP